MMPNDQNRRSSFSSSTVSSLAKRQASDAHTKPNASSSPHVTKKRAPLSYITNQMKEPKISDSCSNATMKKASGPPVRPNGGLSSATNAKKITVPHNRFQSLPIENQAASSVNFIPTNSLTEISSPSKSDEVSNESMSICDSFSSPQVEYIDKNEVTSVESVERQALDNLHITENEEAKGTYCRRDVLSEIEAGHDKVDPPLCATYSCDMYKHLRASEAKKRPSAGYFERVQKDINARMRSILIDWLVQVAEQYRLVPDTLHLTVNYIDRYLSENLVSMQRLQLLGVACMFIAAKHVEICVPQVEDFCYITDNAYFKKEVLEMESCVLKYLKFDKTAPTAICFLRRFIKAAQGIHEVPSVLECLANYITELSLLDYKIVSHAPSLVAASAIFLAKYILDPSKRPWNSTLQHYTLYQPSDLRVCVKDLHRLFNNSHTSTTLHAIRDKYNHHRYKFVARKCCLPVILSEFFTN